MSYSIGFDIFAKDRASKTFSEVGDSADKTGGRISKFGAMAAAGAAVAAVAFVKVGSASVSSASNQSEALNKSSVIFGKNAADIEKWADTAYKSIGLSKTAALEAVSGFGDMFQQLGFTGSKATDMSKSVVQMSADLGSFNNLPTAEVADMMAGAFRGEYDSLQRLIPNINAARVESEAQRLGLVKNTVDVRKLAQAREVQSLAEKKYAEAVRDHGKDSDEARRAALTLGKAQDGVAKAAKGAKGDISEQAKAQAILSIVQKDGARASGDFARTSGGLANQQKILKAAFEDTKAKIGMALLPMLTRLGAWFINDGLPAIQRFGGWISGKLWPALKQGYQTIMPGLKQALSIVSGGVGSGEISWKKLGDIITGKVIPFIAKLTNVYLPAWAVQIRVVIEVVKKVWAVFQTLMSIVSSVVVFILKRFADLTSMWAGVLRALAKVPGFGWAKDAAAKMDAASGKARALASSIERIPNKKNVTIDVNARVMTGRIKVGNEYVNIGMRAAGGPVVKGRPYIVGENEPEVFVPNQSGQIFNQSQIRSGQAGAAVGVGASDDRPILVQLLLDGQVIQQSLLKRKRQTGTALGLA